MYTLAEVVSDVLQRLGNPPAEWLTPKAVFRIARARMVYYGTAIQQSDQNQKVNFYEFTPTGREEILPTITNPAWVERRIWQGDSTIQGAMGELWEYVPTVNIDSLEDWRNEGMAAASFYQNAQTEQLILRLSFAPVEWGGANWRYRVWYDQTVPLQSTLAGKSGLPPNFNFMLSADVRSQSIGLLLNNAAKYAGESPVNELQITAWKALQSEANNELADWRGAFDEHKNRSRGGQRGRNRRPVLRQWR